MSRYNKNNQALKPPYKWLLALVILLIGLGYFWNKKQNPRQGGEHQEVIAANAHLSFTKHAKCRMACRDISEEEIREVLEEGHINYRKSDSQDHPCPTYAIEDRVKSGQNLRIVFGVCNNEVKVITCIDLGVEHDCDCE